MLQPHNCLRHQDISAAFTKSDTAGEVILAEDSPSATQRIERAPKHACGRMSDFASSIKSDDEPISVTHMAC